MYADELVINTVIRLFLDQPGPLREVTSSSSFDIIVYSRWYTSCLLVKHSCVFVKSVPTLLKNVMFKQLHILCYNKLMHSGSGS